MSRYRKDTTCHNPSLDGRPSADAGSYTKVPPGTYNPDERLCSSPTMPFDAIVVGQRYWVWLDFDNMYGADDPGNPLCEVVVLNKNEAHLDVETRDVESDDEFILEPDRFYPTKELAEAAIRLAVPAP